MVEAPHATAWRPLACVCEWNLIQNRTRAPPTLHGLS